MSKVHSFQKSLKKGKKAEREFFELFQDKVQQLDGYTSDFEVIRTGKRLELKTESRCTSQTPNLFIEKFSYGNEPGGPYQALNKKSDFYIHWFPQTMEFFVYRTATLVAWLDANMPKPWLINIKNESHTTRGFVVKRAAIQHLALNLEDIL